MPIDFSKHKKGDVVRVHCCDSCARAAGIQPKCPPDSGSRSWPCEVCGHWGIGSATDCTIGDWLILHPNKRLTAETSNARGEWVLVPRNPTEAMIDAWRDAPNRWVEAYAAMLAAAPQPPSAPVGAEGHYHPCTSILIEGLKRLDGGDAVLAEWDRGRAKASAALAAQPGGAE